jgi:hypothetical protein
MRRHAIKSKPQTAFAYLKPRPDLVVGALAGLGLSDARIGRYFGVGEEAIAAIPHASFGNPAAKPRSARNPEAISA